MQNTLCKEVNFGTLYLYGRVSHFDQLPHTFQKDFTEVLKDLSSSTRLK